MRSRQPAQATAEIGIVSLLLVLLVVGMIAVAALVQIQMSLATVAEEAALAATMAPSVDAVEQRGVDRGLEVAAGYALRNGSLQVMIDPSDFRPGGIVRARASYRMTSADVPLLTVGTIVLARDHVERVPRFRSLVTP
jgi:hypothetical protein